MNDEHESEGDEAPRPVVKKKKKKRRRVVAAEPALDRPRVKKAQLAAPSDAMQWSGNHVAIALVAGLAVGAAGGYFVAKGGSGAAAKDDAQAMGSGQRPALDARGNPQQPMGRVFVPLASYTARRGPEHAKVTIVDFSDFQ